MTIYAVVQNGVVQNIAESEDKTTLELLLPKFKIIEETPQTGIAWIGSEVINDRFKPFQKYPSWSFNSDTFEWEAPVLMPNQAPRGVYVWDEENTQWFDFVPETTEPSA